MTATEQTEITERPSDRRRRAKFEAIIAAASDLFARNGYEETGLADVAAAVDLTPKAIYHYCASKHELLGHVIARGFQYFDADSFATVRPKWVGLAVEQALLESSIEAVHALASHGDLLRVSFSESFRGNAETSARHTRYMVDWVDHVVEVLLAAESDGAFDAKSARVLAVQVVDALFGICVDGVLRYRPELVTKSGRVRPNRKFFEELTATLLRGATTAPAGAAK